MSVKKSIANDYITDATEHLRRFDLCFQDVELLQKRSWDVKLFLDLKLAYECLLKGILIHYENSVIKKDALLKMATKHKHDINALEKSIRKKDVPEELKQLIVKIDKRICDIPLDLRYRVDSEDFRIAHQELHYEVIRDTDWIIKFYNQIRDLLNEFNKFRSAEEKPKQWGSSARQLRAELRDFLDGNKYLKKLNRKNNK